MLEVKPKYNAILLEALEELMYKLSLQLNDMKGQPMSKRRKELVKKQKLVEELQHLVYVAGS